MDMAYRPKQSFTEEEKVEARMLLAALRPFTGVRHTIPLQLVLAYFQVIVDEGRSVNDYASKSGVAQSVMSRHLLDLGARNRYGKGEGFGLVETGVNPIDPRNREIKLTQKGRGLYNRIREAIAPYKRK
jgi:DNA-binding MarR family transcriptional regulator